MTLNLDDMEARARWALQDWVCNSTIANPELLLTNYLKLCAEVRRLEAMVNTEDWIHEIAADARAEAAEARVVELERELNKWHRRGYDLNADIAKLAAKLQVAVEAIERLVKEGDHWDMSMVCWIGSNALAKLRGQGEGA
jgi:hypothetical protein